MVVKEISVLDDYCATVLRRELSGADYDGKTVDEAWAWLMLPRAQAPLSEPTGLRLTPVILAGLVGAAKAEACATALKAAYPVIGDHLMREGIDPLKAESAAFLGGLVAATVLSTEDAVAITAAAARPIPVPSLPRRFDRRFDPDRWPHVAADGDVGKDSDPAIHGFPNDIDRADFNAAWLAAGRST